MVTFPIIYSINNGWFLAEVYYKLFKIYKKIFRKSTFQSKKDRKNPHWNLTWAYFICADYNESPYTTDLLLIYHRLLSSFNMDFPLVFTFCFFVAWPWNWGPCAMSVPTRFLISLYIKAVGKSAINYRYPISSIHFAIEALRFIYSSGEAQLSGDYFILQTVDYK